VVRQGNPAAQAASVCCQAAATAARAGTAAWPASFAPEAGIGSWQDVGPPAGIVPGATVSAVRKLTSSTGSPSNTHSNWGASNGSLEERSADLISHYLYARAISSIFTNDPFYQALKSPWKAILRLFFKDKKADLHVATRFKSPKAFYLAEIVVAIT